MAVSQRSRYIRTLHHQRERAGAHLSHVQALQPERRGPQSGPSLPAASLAPIRITIPQHPRYPSTPAPQPAHFGHVGAPSRYSLSPGSGSRPTSHSAAPPESTPKGCLRTSAAVRGGGGSGADPGRPRVLRVGLGARHMGTGELR